MKLTGLEATPIELPFREPYRTASGELEGRSMIVVRLSAAWGDVGLGEAVPLSLRGGPGLAAVEAELRSCGEALADADAEAARSRDPGRIRAWVWELLERCRAQSAGPQAIAAIDTALHDLAGRASGLPVWRLLGATTVRGVSCNATLDAGDPEHVARLAVAQRDAGFESHKIKVGRGADGERVRAVREALGPAARIRIDANAAWSPPQAMAMLEELAGCSLELVEQPCAGLAELAAVRAATETPVVADESVASLDDAHAAREARACDLATLKLAKVGGPLEALRIGAALPSYLSSALDGPIGIAAAVHTAQAMPRPLRSHGVAEGLATLSMFSAVYAPCDELCGPVLTPARSPGLGIEIDDRALEGLRVR